ncbi:DUF6528 family protein [Streptomyces sp. NRRL S-350]|uniref:DUF6528 family protein n=1 Tax=Streptomyces sp. NRRL S-350 TaxID=1463902 RepID=UPI00131C8B89|nr:DUF6528 family protein [Streptomyces sp. NRRL S-350]
MNRRSLLKGAAAAAFGAPLASLAMPTDAQAVGGAYDVAVCEQAKNQILIHPAGTDWTPQNRKWSWTPPTAVVNGFNTWTNLSDVRFRDTTAHGWVALVAASYGKVGMVDIGDGDALLWSARPYGNPHAIERIPGVGAVVVASSEADTGFGGPGNHPPVTTTEGGKSVTRQGFLTIYAPQAGQSDNPASLTKVDEFEFNGAHGLWYDGTYLWVLGTDLLVRYACTGSALNFRLADSGVRIPVSNGHSLDTDYRDPGYLLFTEGSAVKRLDKSGTVPQLWTPTGAGVKSYSRTASGESFWLQAINVTDPVHFPDPDKGYWNTYVQFFNPSGGTYFTRPLTGYGYDAKFYKARLSSVAFS